MSSSRDSDTETGARSTVGALESDALGLQIVVIGRVNGGADGYRLAYLTR